MMWGLHGSAEANTALSDIHTLRGRITPKHNLIVEAMNAGMVTPTPTPTPMPTPTSTPTPTPTPTPAPTPTSTTTTSAASQLGLRVVMFSILSVASCVLSSF